jgi:tRNA pseudouridine32 synthase/23S rRNA pseudouridine746 synthase
MQAMADLPVLYRDRWVVVVDKPAGLLCQPGLGPAQLDSLIRRVQRCEPGLALVHRLDRDTSGLLLLARNPEALAAFSGLFAHRRVRKLYVADICTDPPAFAGLIDLPLARLQRHPPRYGEHPQGRASRTRWRVAASAGSLRRLWLQPITGRSHQLRAHLAALGCPIQGDPIYAADQGRSMTGRMHLHATALSLLHPFTGKRLRCRSAVPFASSLD